MARRACVSCGSQCPPRARCIACAIISGAALINALDIQGKKIDEVRIVVSGAGAAAISCSRFYVLLGARRENIYMFDREGLVWSGRTDLDPYKAEFSNGDEKDPLRVQRLTRTLAKLG